MANRQRFTHTYLTRTILAFCLMATVQVSASEFNWNATSGGVWSDLSATGWNAARYPNASGDEVAVRTDITSAQSLEIDVADAILGSLTVGDLSGTSAWSVETTDATMNKLVFDVSAGEASLNTQNGANTISAPMVLRKTLNVNNASSLTLAGVISDDATGSGLTKSGNGMLIFTGAANTYTGLTTITGGTVELRKSSGTRSLPGDVRITGGTLRYRQDHTSFNKNQIANTAHVTVDGGAYNLYDDCRETVSRLTLKSGSVTVQEAWSPSQLNITNALDVQGGTFTLWSGRRSDMTYVSSINRMEISETGSVVIRDRRGRLASMTVGSGGLSLIQSERENGVVLTLNNSDVAGSTARLTLAGDLTYTGEAGVATELVVASTYTDPGSPEDNQIVIAAVRRITVNKNANAADIDLTIQPRLSGAGGITKEGDGTLRLAPTNGANVYTGATVVDAGRLILNGDLSSSLVQVKSGATLEGSGVLEGNLELQPGSRLRVVLEGGEAVAQYGQLTVEGSIEVSDAELDLICAFNPAPGDVFTLVRNTGTTAITGTFANLPEGGGSVLVDGRLFQLSYAGGEGKDLVLTALNRATLLTIR